MMRKLAILGAVALTLPGCFYAHTSQAPIAKTYPLTEQHKMQAAHHWRVLAQHEASGIVASLDGQTVYVDVGDDQAVFNRTFKQLLSEELVKQGALVMLQPGAAATVQYDVNLIEHKDRGYIRPPEGALTALTAGIMVASLPYNQWSNPELALLPAAVIGDVLIGNATSETPYEIAITTQVVKSGMLKHSSTNLYYINGGDKDHYQRPAQSARKIRVTDH